MHKVPNAPHRGAGPDILLVQQCPLQRLRTHMGANQPRSLNGRWPPLQHLRPRGRCSRAGVPRGLGLQRPCSTTAVERVGSPLPGVPCCEAHGAVPFYGAWARGACLACPRQWDHTSCSAGARASGFRCTSSKVATHMGLGCHAPVHQVRRQVDARRPGADLSYRA